LPRGIRLRTEVSTMDKKTNDSGKNKKTNAPAKPAAGMQAKSHTSMPAGSKPAATSKGMNKS
jgi:hypothetical protein